MSASRAAIILVSSAGAGLVLRFLRNILIARLISVEDYGIASTFIVAISLVDLALNLGIGQLMIQNRAGDDPRYIAALKGLTILRGFTISAILFIAAGPIAMLFNQDDLVWAYQVIALVPLIRCLGHPDMVRFQRRMRFGASSLINLGSLTVTLGLVWPLALIFGDYRMMLAIYLIEAVLTLGLSFLLAERPYRLRWDRKIAGEAIRFGWPLTMSGLVTFAAMQGDRIIVANRFDAETLGLFSAAMTLTMPVAMVVSQLGRSFFLPYLAPHQDEAHEFGRRAALVVQSSLCATLAAVLGFAVLGGPALVVAFGERYADAAPLVGILGVVFGFQIARTGSAMVALALGRTMDLLTANIVRLAFLPAAFLVAIAGGSIFDIIAVGAAGQVFGFITSLLLLWRHLRPESLKRIVPPAALCGLAAVVVSFGLRQSMDGTLSPAFAFAAGGMLVITLVVCSDLRRELIRIASRYL